MQERRAKEPAPRVDLTNRDTIRALKQLLREGLYPRSHVETLRREAQSTRLKLEAAEAEIERLTAERASLKP